MDTDKLMDEAYEKYCGHEFNGNDSAAFDFAAGWRAALTHSDTVRPPLADGEIYGGAIIDHTGRGHHFIWLPGDSDRASWVDQMEWAKSIGGDLPSRTELLLACEKYSDQFQKTGYWSNMPADDPPFVVDSYWYQIFPGGYQTGLRHHNEIRARAVRRVPVNFQS